jgi:4'-phosphopantetheinyl transferase
MSALPSQSPALPADRVLVQLFALSSSGSPEQFAEWLDEAEMARARSFSSPEAQSRFASCRSQVKQILSNATGLAASDIHFQTSVHGKPYLPAPYFNYANTRTHGALAVCASAVIGLDLEDTTRKCNIPGLMRLFHPAEREQLERLTGGELRKAFFTLWVRKEAVMKADGRGLVIGVGNICADGKAEAETVTIFSKDGTAGSRWRVPVRRIGHLALAVAVPLDRPDITIQFPEA